MFLDSWMIDLESSSFFLPSCCALLLKSLTIAVAALRFKYWVSDSETWGDK